MASLSESMHTCESHNMTVSVKHQKEHHERSTAELTVGKICNIKVAVGDASRQQRPALLAIECSSLMKRRAQQHRDPLPREHSALLAKGTREDSQRMEADACLKDEQLSEIESARVPNSVMVPGIQADKEFPAAEGSDSSLKVIEEGGGETGSIDTELDMKEEFKLSPRVVSMAKTHTPVALQQEDHTPIAKPAAVLVEIPVAVPVALPQADHTPAAKPAAAAPVEIPVAAPVPLQQEDHTPIAKPAVLVEIPVAAPVQLQQRSRTPASRPVRSSHLSVLEGSTAASMRLAIRAALIRLIFNRARPLAAAPVEIPVAVPVELQQQDQIPIAQPAAAPVEISVAVPEPKQRNVKSFGNFLETCSTAAPTLDMLPDLEDFEECSNPEVSQENNDFLEMDMEQLARELTPSSVVIEAMQKGKAYMPSSAKLSKDCELYDLTEDDEECCFDTSAQIIA